MRFGNGVVYFSNINSNQYLSDPWQANTQVARSRLAHEYPKAVLYTGDPVHTGTQGGQMTDAQKMHAPSPAVVIGPLITGTMF